MFHEDSIESPDEGDVLDVQQQPAEDATPAQPSVDSSTRQQRGERASNRCGRPKSNGSGPCPATVSGPGKACPMHDDSPEGRARMALARSQGGKAARVKLGLDTAVVDGITLADSEGQLAVLTAATKALAVGAISSTTATAISALVRTANQIAATDQSSAIAELEHRIDQLADQNTIKVRR